MLTIAKTLSYINRKLGGRFVSLELEQQDIIDVITEDALPEFTRYIPDINFIMINRHDTALRVNPKIENLFWVKDPDGRRVLVITDVIPDLGSQIVHGYPLVMPITSFEDVDDIALQIQTSELAMMFSKNDLTWSQERELNQIWLYAIDSLCVDFKVEYTREHNPDLSTIPIEHEALFKDLCRAHVMENIGEIRKKYGTLATPMGDIAISADIASDGKELHSTVTEELKKNETVYVNVFVG